jgi:hypothetical protein
VRASADAPFVSAEQFSSLISQLYEAAMDPEGWKPFWRPCVCNWAAITLRS